MFKIMMVTLTASLFMLFSATTAADPVNQDTIKNIAKQYGIPYKPVGKGEYGKETSAFKVWPGDPTLTLVAIISSFKNKVQSAESDDVEQSMVIELFVVNSNDGKVIKHVTKEIPSDSEGLFTGMSFDTANYNLNARERAFGLRVKFAYSGNPGVDRTFLSLFVFQDKNLRSVLKAFNIYADYGDHNYYGETNRTIALADTSSHGDRDLLVTEIDGPLHSKCGDDDAKCVDDNGKAGPAHKHTLRFDGKKYQSLDDICIEFMSECKAR